MKDLYDYILNEGSNIDEGIVSNTMSLAIIKNLDEKEFIDGLLNMYDYICDEDDIELFYQDFPLKQRPLWKTLYNMYKNKVWSIFDIENSEEIMNELGLEPNVMQKVTVGLRRNLRKLIKDSNNSKLELKPSEIDKILPVYDEKYDKTYIITLNRTTGLFRKLFRSVDLKFLESYLNKFATKLEKDEINID